MIDIKLLTKKDIGKWVVYTTSYGKKETGKLKSWNLQFIFVVYKCDSNWDKFFNYTGCATHPDDLSFTNKVEVS